MDLRFAARIGTKQLGIDQKQFVGLELKGNGRVNEILGQGHANHDFDSTFICNSLDSKKYSWQIPIEFKFTSRPKGCSIIGGPLLYAGRRLARLSLQRFYRETFIIFSSNGSQKVSH